MIKEFCKVMAVELLGSGICQITFLTNDMGKTARCGQFVHIKCGEENFLRRPISICEVLPVYDNLNGRKTLTQSLVRIVFDIKGKGTTWLASLRVGDVLDVLGPLGNGFDLEKAGDSPVLIGGGIGVPPMLETAKTLAAYGKKPQVILGFRSNNQVILREEFTPYAASVDICTNDGSFGRKGFVSDILAEKIKSEQVSTVYACGPRPMLKAIVDLAIPTDLPCYVSMEELMGCGVGACLVCACKVASKDRDFDMKHVCKDGPVFDGREVLF